MMCFMSSSIRFVMLFMHMTQCMRGAYMHISSFQSLGVCDVRLINHMHTHMCSQPAVFTVFFRSYVLSCQAFAVS